MFIWLHNSQKKFKKPFLTFYIWEFRPVRNKDNKKESNFNESAMSEKFGFKAEYI